MVAVPPVLATGEGGGGGGACCCLRNGPPPRGISCTTDRRSEAEDRGGVMRASVVAWNATMTKNDNNDNFMDANCRILSSKILVEWVFYLVVGIQYEWTVDGMRKGELMDHHSSHKIGLLKSLERLVLNLDGTNYLSSVYARSFFIIITSTNIRGGRKEVRMSHVNVLI